MTMPKITPLRAALTGLALGTALAAPAAAFDMEAMTPAERTAFRAEIRAYLLDNPEVLMEAIGVLEAREQAAQAAGDRDLIASLSDEIFDDGRSWVGGNPDGDVTLVEFMDYRCSYCRRAHEDVMELLDRDGDIRFVVKEFPILGPESLLASRFAIAVRNVAGDDAYGTVHDALMTLRGTVTEDSLNRIARDAGLDSAAINAAMDAPAVVAELQANRALAERLGINGTPGFVLGDEILRGYLPLAQMEERVAQVRAD
jgi:protein-disulfide isomerase